MVIKIQCHEKIGEGIINMLSALQAAAEVNHPDGTFNEDLFSMELQLVDPKPREASAKQAAPKVHYKALFPIKVSEKNREKIMEQVEKNLKALNKSDSSMHGVIYRDIVLATIDNQQITKNDIRNRRSLVASSAERVIGDLVRGGLVSSIPVINT